MRLLAAVLSFALVACGGGGRHSFAFFGDSTTEALGLAVRPVPQIAQMAGVEATDYSKAGMTSQDAEPTFARVLAADRNTHVVLRFGGADCMRYAGTGIAAFERTTRWMVGAVRAAGKTPLLTTTVRIAPWPEFTDEMNGVYLRALVQYNDAIRRVALDTGTQLIDVDARVPFFGRSDLLDIVHPNQAYSDRISTFIAAELP
jgi:hypothetical protein